jgi:L-fucose isomerase-like protein
LRNARIGAIGARPAPFQTVRFSEKILQTSGITVVPVDLSQIIFGAQSLSDGDKVVQAKLEEIKGWPHPGAYSSRKRPETGQALNRDRSLDGRQPV